MDLEKEKCFFDQYIPEELERVIKQQHKVIEYQKKNDHKKLSSILILMISRIQKISRAIVRY